MLLGAVPLVFAFCSLAGWDYGRFRIIQRRWNILQQQSQISLRQKKQTYSIFNIVLIHFSIL